ncbi:Haloacid Dehalogenase Superfamily Class (subfamily) IIA [Brevibacterium sandarakinum]|uniref:Haloacid Dehalogenase Superfamily Class (Subfamily) IIA n=1 Tax=Brevibacterium sandarakinum TaxID=629680 RepID=A0A1H1WS67_BRESA|nr:HAD-IIA family hydrolase [Brevibacterium sandarakinum]SDT00003.1 Haloacid Dehalogenase Superfamily Class (subfamily) IIA [Brevibacterium sandarakinum]
MTPTANAASPVDRRAPEKSGAPIDCVLFDLDGVVYHGPDPISGAVEGIAWLHEQSIPVNYVTNNATRTAEVVADHISTLGIRTTPAEVTTSAQVLAGQLAAKFGTGAPIYLVGTTGLATALTTAGLTVTGTLDDEPVAIAQGLDPDIDYTTIVAACEAIESGLEWWATNPDYSMVGPRSRVPGNGAFIDMLSRLTGVQPTIVGKPSPHMMDFAAHRIGAKRPLMIGDRLDTDIEGGNAAGFETALVLTGVHDIHDALTARPGLRPTSILPSLRSLPTLIADSAQPAPGPSAEDASGTAACRIVDGELHLDEPARTEVSTVENALRLAWEAMDRGEDVAPGNLPRRIHD